jgi:Ala-tRNA(Pro) deacylase
MPATEQDLHARLAALGIAATTVRHPPLHTVEESKRLRGDLTGGHCKNLFLTDRKAALLLVVVLEDREVDVNRLHRRLGLPGVGRLSFGKPDLLMEVLGITPGAVTPFALINDAAGRVTVVLDRAMLSFPRLNYHPLTNTATTSVTPDDLLRFVRACGHEPRILDFDSPEQA